MIRRRSRRGCPRWRSGASHPVPAVDSESRLPLNVAAPVLGFLTELRPRCRFIAAAMDWAMKSRNNPPNELSQTQPASIQPAPLQIMSSRRRSVNRDAQESPQERVQILRHGEPCKISPAEQAIIGDAFHGNDLQGPQLTYSVAELNGRWFPTCPDPIR